MAAYFPKSGLLSRFWVADEYAYGTAREIDAGSPRDNLGFCAIELNARIANAQLRSDKQAIQCHLGATAERALGRAEGIEHRCTNGPARQEG